VAVGSASAEPAVHAATACTVNEAGLEYHGQNGAAGTLIEEFEFVAKNRRVHCSLSGFPKVTLLKKSGRELPIKVRRSHNRKSRTLGLRKGKPIAFEVAHPSADPDTTQPCKIKVYGFRIHVRGLGKDLDLQLPSPVNFCDKGARRTAFGRPR
jgi:hypothetical protein